MNSLCLRTVLLLLVFAAYASSGLTAQSQDSIYATVEHATVLQTDTTVEVRVFATGEPEIVAFQISLLWAEDELTFESLTFGSVISSFDQAHNLVTPGELRALASTLSLIPVSVQEDSLLMSLRFRILPGFSGNTPINDEMRITTEFVGIGGLSVPHSIRQGFVSYGQPSMHTGFSVPYADAVVAGQFCVDLNTEVAYAIAGFDLELNWDAVAFPLVEVKLGDNPLGLSEEEISFSTDQLVLNRNPTENVRFSAILQPTTVASLCFTTSDPDAVSSLSFGGRDGTDIYGYSPTGEIITVSDSDLKEGTISQPEASGVFGTTTTLLALKLYPNPARDIVRLEGLDATREYQLTLWDELGRSTRQENQRGVTLDLSSLPPGAYTLGVVQGSKRWLNRLIVSHE